MPIRLAIKDFLKLAERCPVVDVRSPGEFEKGRIPGASNIPLFDDEQRAEIGTLYKTDGRQAAVLRGLDIAGGKMRSLAESALELTPATSKQICVYCWRGGMRSGSLSWLLEQVDIQVYVLDGGYKAFRNHALATLSGPLPLVVLSGLTGAGKTHQIELLRQGGQQVVDLESLANHRGSAFGSIGLGSQPTVEHFENKLATEFLSLDWSRQIWVEDESRSIGDAKLPDAFYSQLKKAPAIFMDVPRAARSRVITREYGLLNQQDIVNSIRKITKRMGGQNVKRAIDLIESGDMSGCVDILLEYYDRTYLKSKARIDRDVFFNLPAERPLSPETTELILSTADSLGILTSRANHNV